MRNNGLFSTLFIDEIRSAVELDDTGRGRMAALYHARQHSDRSSSDSIWNTYIKQALSYLSFVPHGQADASGVYPLYDDYTFSNTVTILYLIEPGADLDDMCIGRFWPGTLIAQMRDRKLNWGILTDGARWRLYTTRTGKPFEEYVELNLAEALEQNDEKEYALFERFFHVDSFTAEIDDEENDRREKDARAHGVYNCRLDQDIKASEKILEDKVKSPLLEQIDEVLQYLCNGFISETPRKGNEYTEDERREIFESAVKLLYRCLFLFYAEARSLLPSQIEKREIYAKHSISALCLEAHRFRWGKRTDHDGYDLWKHLKGLIGAVNDGDPEYGIMGYNGGLFDDEAEKFLGKEQLRNDFLARALYLMAWVELHDGDTEKEYQIPYRDLEVRHLGEMYETILEFSVTLADADRLRRRSKKGIEILLASETTRQKGDGSIRKGDVYFGESALERKQTGSYYTPESLVHFLNAKAIIEPLRVRFETECRERFDLFIHQAKTGHDVTIRRGAAQSAVALVERFVWEVILRFKLCDPAMGSGHFLVNAANQITDFIVGLLAEIPHVEGMVSPVRCEPNVWRRLVTRHCLYGADLNPLAVHLSKLSLWLNCFARDHKLTFLDHHLRCGNSLIGIRNLSQLEKIPVRSKDDKKKLQKEKNLQELPFPETLTEAYQKAAQDMISITQMAEDDTDRQKDLHEVTRRERIKPLIPLADLYTAYLMDGTMRPGDYETLFLRLSRREDPASVAEMELDDRTKFLAGSHSFFHWPLEFPDVFTGEAGGFDADVGNPPWDMVKLNSQEFFSNYDPVFRKYGKQDAISRVNHLMEQNPAIRKKWIEYENLFREQINYFREPHAYNSLGSGHINTFKIFLERCFRILKKDGRLGMVVPSGLYTDHGCQPFRELFFNESRIICLYGFENRWPTVFTAVDGRFKFILFCTEKGGKTEAFHCAFMEHNPDRLPAIEKNSLKMTVKDVCKFSPDSLSIMEFNNQRDIDISARIYDEWQLLGPYLKTNWNTGFQREFNMTDDTDLFTNRVDSHLALDYVPLWEGKQIWILDYGMADPTYWILRSDASVKTTIKDMRIGYRALAASTNERTFIVSVIPKYFPTGNSINICPLPSGYSIILAAILSSFIVDWIVRGKVTTNLNMFMIDQLPIVDLYHTDPSQTEDSSINRMKEAILCRAARLLCTTKAFAGLWEDCFDKKWSLPDFWYSPEDINTKVYGPLNEQEIRRRLAEDAVNLAHGWTSSCGVHDRTLDRRDSGDRAQLRAEIDAYVAHLYGLTRDDFAYILDTFPVLKRKEEQVFGEFMSKRKCLEEYDRVKAILY